MRNPAQEAIRTICEQHGLTPSEELVADLLAVVLDEDIQVVQYEVGDFVEVYYGMGECGFGEVIESHTEYYVVNIWDESTEEFTHPRRVYGDISRLSSKEEARDYYLVRTGQKKL